MLLGLFHSLAARVHLLAQPAHLLFAKPAILEERLELPLVFGELGSPGLRLLVQDRVFVSQTARACIQVLLHGPQPMQSALEFPGLAFLLREDQASLSVRLGGVPALFFLNAHPLSQFAHFLA